MYPCASANIFPNGFVLHLSDDLRNIILLSLPQIPAVYPFAWLHDLDIVYSCDIHHFTFGRRGNHAYNNVRAMIKMSTSVAAFNGCEFQLYYSTVLSWQGFQYRN